MKTAALGAVAAIAGCGADPAICTVRADPAQCWPDTTRAPQGTATLGTGRGAFEPMPELLPLEYGSQDGFNLVAHVRMTGFDPGDPQNLLDPGNPRTRIRAFFADSNTPLNYFAACPFRTAYIPSAGGGYELVAGVAVVFETCWRSDRLVGKQIRIELELMDDCGGYTTDVKTVTAGAPPGSYPIEHDTPGCIHATDR